MKRNGASQYDFYLEQVSYGRGFPRPKNMVIKKGSKNVALEKSMVEFIIQDPVSWELENYLSSAKMADEHFYQSLISSAKSKGKMRIPPNNYDINYVRYTIWTSSGQYCHGRMIREVCNFAIGDLEGIKHGKCFTANKFNLEVDPLAVMCQMKYLRSIK